MENMSKWQKQLYFLNHRFKSSKAHCGNTDFLPWLICWLVPPFLHLCSLPPLYCPIPLAVLPLAPLVTSILSFSDPFTFRQRGLATDICVRSDYTDHMLNNSLAFCTEYPAPWRAVIYSLVSATLALITCCWSSSQMCFIWLWLWHELDFALRSLSFTIQ